jgi:hypothetical protein
MVAVLASKCPFHRDGEGKGEEPLTARLENQLTNKEHSLYELAP